MEVDRGYINELFVDIAKLKVNTKRILTEVMLIEKLLGVGVLPNDQRKGKECVGCVFEGGVMNKLGSCEAGDYQTRVQHFMYVHREEHLIIHQMPSL